MLKLRSIDLSDYAVLDGRQRIGRICLATERMSFLTQAGLWLDDDPLGIPQPRDLLSPRQRKGVGQIFAEIEEVVLCSDRAGDQSEAPEPAPLGLVSVFALVAVGVNFDIHPVS